MRKLAQLQKKRAKILTEFKLSQQKPSKVKDVDFSGTFLERAANHATNDRGDNITLYNWHNEYFELISNMAIAEIYTSGGSQIGKTFAHYLLASDLVAQGFNIIWAYDQERNLNRCVPLQFRPIIDAYFNSLGINSENGKAKNNTLYQGDKGTAIFTYTSTTKTTNNKGAAAGSSVVSVTADVLFIEERSQHLIGTVSPLYRRLDAGKLPMHPVRQLGTPGNGTGIEEEINKADYHFYPAVQCPNCQTEIFLDPKGCLLKPMEVKGKLKYLSPTGKPNDNWYHHDKSNPVNSAYFACPECNHELDTETRTKLAYFVDRNTGINLKNFLQDFEPKDYRYKVGITLSPLLRESTFNLARDIIESGLNTSNADDWQQQRLGHPSISTQGNISLDAIKESIEYNSKFDRKPDFVLAGIDQGRSSHWIMIIEYYIPTSTYLRGYTKNERIDMSYRNVLLARDCTVQEIPQILEDYNVGFGVIDNEPDRESTSRLCESTVLEMADQKGNTLKDVELSTVLHGGMEYPCYKVNNLKFLRRVLNCFSLYDIFEEPITRLPDDWTYWLNNNSEISPVRHLRSPRFNAETNKWERTDHTDDLFYAFMFCEVAFSLVALKNRGFWDQL